jgi:hypothetical protein
MHESTREKQFFFGCLKLRRQKCLIYEVDEFIGTIERLVMYEKLFLFSVKLLGRFFIENHNRNNNKTLNNNENQRFPLSRACDSPELREDETLFNALP